MRAIFIFLACLLTAMPIAADSEFPVRIKAPGGEVILGNARERDVMHGQLTYAATRRAGDFVYISGLEIGPRTGEGRDVAAFKAQVRRGLTTIQTRLESAGATFQHVVQLQSFHNCDTPYFEGDFDAQLGAIVEVKAEFMKPPYSTWTALCVSGHYTESTVVEIQATAFAPIADEDP